MRHPPLNSYLAAAAHLLFGNRGNGKNWEVLSMNALLVRARHLLVSEDGPTAVEYAVMLALIVVVCLATITTIGTNANATFNQISNALPAAS
jgi:pilus assembly protein Flp/PilA